MKKAFKPLLVLFCACGILACSNSNDVVEEQEVEQQRPLVDYEIVPGTDPFTFTFKNKSTNYKNLEWRFGDDSLSVEESPTHIFLADGKYEVNLKATSETGATGRKLIVVQIDPEKVAKITAKGTSKYGEVKFTASSAANLVSAEWDFGNGKTSKELSPTTEYEDGKLFTAKVTVTTDKGSKVTVNKLVSKDGTLVEVINGYLLNVGPKFATSQRFGGRWGIPAEWRVNAAVKQREGGMGGWDEWEGNSMSMESWGSEPDIINGKIEQTSLVPLPAGQYFYELKFHDFQSKDLLYAVIAKGNSLPDVDNVTTDPTVLGYTKFTGNGPLLSYTGFKVTEPQPVTFGFVSTMIQPDQNFKLTQIRLYKQDE